MSRIRIKRTVMNDEQIHIKRTRMKDEQDTDKTDYNEG